jgi:CspA family cold shock protein
MADILKGPVKWFNDAKGFGFIEHTTGKDVFVHYSVIEWDGFKTLKDGEEVEYELKAGEKGLHAARVVRVQALEKKKLKEQIEVSTLSSNKLNNSESERINAEIAPNLQTGIAPNLQTGNVSTIYKPSSKMLEIEIKKELELTDENNSLSLVDSNDLEEKQLND